MSGWAKKRFWEEATAEAEGDGFTVRLDGRAVKTPAKAPLVVPTRAMAEAIAGEWQAQEKEIDPTSMPVTRSANAAIDKVAHQHNEVADMIAEYGGSDLLCYRATSPQELIDRQAQVWNPLLDWAAEALDARLEPVSGIMHVAQDSDVLSRLNTRVRAFSNFELAAFHDLVGISGSLIIGFAAALGHRPLQELWEASRVDEMWQEEQWGEDDEASAQAEAKREAFFHAHRFFMMAQN